MRKQTIVTIALAIGLLGLVGYTAKGEYTRYHQTQIQGIAQQVGVEIRYSVASLYAQKNCLQGNNLIDCTKLSFTVPSSSTYGLTEPLTVTYIPDYIVKQIIDAQKATSTK